jgi:hypothetical protein
VFREFVLLCRRLDLYGRELLAVDGTRIKAVNNKVRNFTRNSLEKFIRAADERLVICGGWTRATSRKAERAAARARKTLPRRSKRSAQSAAGSPRERVAKGEPLRPPPQPSHAQNAVRRRPWFTLPI